MRLACCRGQEKAERGVNLLTQMLCHVLLDCSFFFFFFFLSDLWQNIGERHLYRHFSHLLAALSNFVNRNDTKNWPIFHSGNSILWKSHATMATSWVVLLHTLVMTLSDRVQCATLTSYEGNNDHSGEMKKKRGLHVVWQKNRSIQDCWNKKQKLWRQLKEFEDISTDFQRK